MGRGSGCNRIQSILTAEQQAELVRDYLSGMTRNAVMAKWGLPYPPQLYAYLRRNGVQYNKQKPRKKKLFCCVCGAPKQYPKYTPRGAWFTSAHCGDPACKSILVFRSDLRPLWKRSSENPSVPAGPLPIAWDGDICESSLQQEDGKLDAAALAALEKAFHLDVDDRGEQLSEKARKAVWSRLAKVSIAVRLNAENVTETSLTLPKSDSLGAFLRRFFGSGYASFAADAFDVIYLWRCPCVHQHTYVVHSLTEFPTTPGGHGVCPYCSSAALEIA